jgi:hypothetical protein
MRRREQLQKLQDDILWKLSLMRAHLEFGLAMYFQAMATDQPQDDPYLRPWKVARDGTWLLLLVLGYLQYYFMEVHAEIAALPRLEVLV